MNFELADAPSPLPGTYWVVTSRLLAGKYPGDVDTALAERRVLTLRELGIDTFVDLTEAKETGRRVPPYQPFAESLGATTIRHPLQDFAAPQPAALAAVLDSIDESLATGRSVYVHCWAGIGRTGTTVGCWLVRHGLADQADVLSVLGELRVRDSERGHVPSPENPAQRRSVVEWKRGQ